MNNRFEGGWDSKLTQLIRETGYNKDVDIEIGTVKSITPNLRITIDGLKFDLEEDDLVLAERIVGVLETGDQVIVASSNNSQRYFVLDKAVTL